jgi:membrane-associated protease RseP (regulator of RpoE activity)
MWLFLFLLGFITYFVVKSSAANVTRTPVWLLWFVLMIPALIWTLWSVVYGEDQPLPLLLILGPFLVCPGLYWWLVQKGRITPEKKEETSLNPGSEEDKTTTDTKIRPINVQEEKSLRDCFPWGVYYLQQLDYRPQAILCRGKLQTAPEMAYERIKDNVENVFGDRFLVLFQESLQGQPFFALIPNPVTESQPETTSEPLSRPWIALALLVMTIFTSKELQADPMVLSQGLPYALGIISILGIHELSHYLTAIYYKVRTTLPYFIPIPFFLGTFGAFIQMKSPVPHRRALFDVAIAGPLGGLVIALPLLYWGLSQSSVVPISSQGTLIQFQALDPRFSVLLSLISKLALGATLKPGMALDLHPLAIAGYIGIIVTALNLMPFGQLDGGHIIHAMLGQRVAIIVGQMTRIVVVILAFIRRDFFLWAIILLLMPVSDQPALNDVTELDNRRDFLGIFAMVILVSILLPLPKVVAAWLGI